MAAPRRSCPARGPTVHIGEGGQTGGEARFAPRQLSNAIERDLVRPTSVGRGRSAARLNGGVDRRGSAMDFEHSEKARLYIEQVERFVRERVIPNEQTYWDQLGHTDDWRQWRVPPI